MSIVCFRNVGKQFTGSNDASVTALTDLSFDVSGGEHVSILGRSGCGKSTTVNLLLGLTTPNVGEVRVLDLDPVTAGNRLRGAIGCIFQGDRLLPWLTAVGNVALPLELSGVGKDDAMRQARPWLERFGLGDFVHAYPHELSGGMRQRAALARALVERPRLVVADEAFSGLDAVLGRTLRRELRDLTKADGQTVVQITHSIDEAVDVSDRILVFGKPGRCIAEIANTAGNEAATRAAILAALEEAPRLAEAVAT